MAPFYLDSWLRNPLPIAECLLLLEHLGPVPTFWHLWIALQLFSGVEYCELAEVNCMEIDSDLQRFRIPRRMGDHSPLGVARDWIIWANPEALDAWPATQRILPFTSPEGDLPFAKSDQDLRILSQLLLNSFRAYHENYSAAFDGWEVPSRISDRIFYLRRAGLLSRLTPAFVYGRKRTAGLVEVTGSQPVMTISVDLA